MDAKTGREVPVPPQLRRPHPVVAALRDDPKRLGISSPTVRNRSLRIIQGLISAAERDGCTARFSGAGYNDYGHWEPDSHFVIDTGECAVGIRVVQENDRSPHVPTKQELAQRARYEWTRIPEYDHKPSERLLIDLGYSRERRQSKWADRKRWSLDDKLPEILDEIALRHEEAQRLRVEREQREAERQRQLDVAIEKATVRLREAHRAEVLARQANDWSEANHLREYLAAMQATIDEATEPDEIAAARAWLDWARRYAELLDPLKKPLAMPADPEPTQEALRPFLDTEVPQQRVW